MEKVLQGSRLSSLTTEAAVDPPAGNRLLETKETAERRKIKAKRKVGEVECQELEPHGPAVTSNVSPYSCASIHVNVLRSQVIC